MLLTNDINKYMSYYIIYIIYHYADCRLQLCECFILICACEAQTSLNLTKIVDMFNSVFILV